MDDLSVIRSKNNKATKEAEIAKLKKEGKSVLVKQRPGIDNIAQYEVFESVQAARAAAVSKGAGWLVA